MTSNEKVVLTMSFANDISGLTGVECTEGPRNVWAQASGPRVRPTASLITAEYILEPPFQFHLDPALLVTLIKEPQRAYSKSRTAETFQELPSRHIL